MSNGTIRAIPCRFFSRARSQSDSRHSTLAVCGIRLRKTHTGFELPGISRQSGGMPSSPVAVHADLTASLLSIDADERPYWKGREVEIQIIRHWSDCEWVTGKCYFAIEGIFREVCLLPVSFTSSGFATSCASFRVSTIEKPDDAPPPRILWVSPLGLTDAAQRAHAAISLPLASRPSDASPASASATTTTVMASTAG